MAQYNSAIEVTFNENDGKAGWRTHPNTAHDIERHIRIFGLWRTRWILFKKFWQALIWLENYSLKKEKGDYALWNFKPEIPE